MAQMLGLVNTLMAKYQNRGITVSQLDFLIMKYPDKTVIAVKSDRESKQVGDLLVDILKSTIGMIKNMDKNAKITIVEKDMTAESPV